MIILNKIKFRYANQTLPTLQIENLTVNSGEKIFLYGPSGCGKTTLLEILSGVLIPQNGSIRLLDTDITALSSTMRDRFRANHIGYIFQSFNLIPYLSVKENVTLPLNLSTIRRKKISIEQENNELLQMCEHLGISAFFNKKVSDLSIGQQQRVAVARAIIGSPEIILADEPTSSLDYNHREKFIKLLFQECEKNKSTVIFVSHDRTLEKLFDRSISLTEINEASHV